MSIKTMLFAVGALALAACHDPGGPVAATKDPDVPVIAASSSSAGLCLAQPEHGNWQNADLNTRSITRIELRQVCDDVSHNGPVQLSPTQAPRPPDFYVRVFGKCYPTDCDWGEVGALRISDGRIFALYDVGWKKTYLWIRLNRDDRLQVTVVTDYWDPNRRDSLYDLYFQRAE